MITKGVKEIELTQLGLEYNLEWRRVLLNIIRVFAESDISIQIILHSCSDHQTKANYIVPDNPPDNDGIRRKTISYSYCT